MSPGTNTEMRTILIDQASRLLADHTGKAMIDDVENGTWPEDLWRELETAGLTRAAVAENHDGAGADFGDALALVRLAGRYAAPVPLAETLIAGWLLSRSGIVPPAGPLSFATGLKTAPLTLKRTGATWSASGTLYDIPWGRRAGAVIATGDDGTNGTDGHRLVILPQTVFTVRENANIAGEPRDTIVLENAPLAEDAVRSMPGDPTGDLGGDALLTLGALSRAVLIAGALEHVLEMSVAYALDREQFGRPIAKFQAIQQELAVLAGETAAAGAAADAAIEAVENGRGAFQIAAAKIRSGEAASQGTAIAHQVHGAMGFTYEHPLHHLTRRLWAWRDEFGTDADWAIRLGALAAGEGGDGLWPLITAS
ncbi:MAG: acyl-CoA dehydrogenase family protein [Rhodospirillales bacterium]